MSVIRYYIVIRDPQFVRIYVHIAIKVSQNGYLSNR